VDWLVLAALGIIWTAFIFPPRRRRSSALASTEEFERHMGLLAETERATGRWIIAPRKGERFIGSTERSRTRSRERRRRAFVFLLEAIGLTFLIGLVPPLRVLWIATGVLVVLLGLYCWMLIGVKHQEQARARGDVGPAPRPAPRHTRQRRPAIAAQRQSHPILLGDDDAVHVRVRAASTLAMNT